MISMIIGSAEGDVKTVRRAGKILDAVEMTEDERRSVNFRQDGSVFKWDDLDREWEIELNDPEAAVLLKEKLTTHRWVAAQHRQVAALFERLGYEL